MHAQGAHLSQRARKHLFQGKRRPVIVMHIRVTNTIACIFDEPGFLRSPCCKLRKVSRQLLALVLSWIFLSPYQLRCFWSLWTCKGVLTMTSVGSKSRDAACLSSGLLRYTEVSGFFNHHLRFAFWVNAETVWRNGLTAWFSLKKKKCDSKAHVGNLVHQQFMQLHSTSSSFNRFEAMPTRRITKWCFRFNEIVGCKLTSEQPIKAFGRESELSQPKSTYLFNCGNAKQRTNARHYLKPTGLTWHVPGPKPVTCSILDAYVIGGRSLHGSLWYIAWDWTEYIALVLYI